MKPDALYLQLIRTEFREKFRHSQIGMLGPWMIKGAMILTVYQVLFFVMAWLLKNGSGELKSAAMGIMVTLAFELVLRLVLPPPAYLAYNTLLVMGIKKKVLARYWLVRSLITSEALMSWVCILALYLLLNQRWEIPTSSVLIIHTVLFLLLQLLVIMSRVMGAIRKWLYWLGIFVSGCIVCGLTSVLIRIENKDSIFPLWGLVLGAVIVYVVLIKLIIRLLVNYVLYES